MSAKYPLNRDWKDVPKFIRPEKWVKLSEEGQCIYHIYEPFQVGKCHPIGYPEGNMIRSFPDYGIMINCKYLEATEQPVDLSDRIAQAVEVLREAKQQAENDQCESMVDELEMMYRAIESAIAILEGEVKGDG